MTGRGGETIVRSICFVTREGSGTMARSICFLWGGGVTKLQDLAIHGNLRLDDGTMIRM